MTEHLLLVAEVLADARAVTAVHTASPPAGLDAETWNDLLLRRCSDLSRSVVALGPTTAFESRLGDCVIARKEGLRECRGCPVYFVPDDARRLYCTDSCRSAHGRARRRRGLGG